MDSYMTEADSNSCQTIIETAPTVSAGDVSSSGNDSFPYVVFGVPILITIVVTWLKYNIGNSIEPRELSKAFIDLCIDSLTVGATVLFAYYNLISAPSSIFWLSCCLIGVMFYCLHIRMKNIKGEISDSFWGVLSLFLCILLSAGILIWLFFKVC